MMLKFVSFESEATSSVEFHCQPGSADTSALAEQLRAGMVLLADTLHLASSPVGDVRLVKGAPADENRMSLRGLPVTLDSPTEPVAEEDWDAGA